MPVITLFPVADALGSTWTPVPAGTSQFERVMDLYSGPDDTASVVTSAGAILNRDLLVETQHAPDLRHPVARVGWVGVWARLNRSGAGFTPVRYAPRLKIGAADIVGPDSTATTIFVDTDPAIVPSWRFETNPATGKDWTWPEALAAVIGIRDTTPSVAAHLLRCTTLLKKVMVAYARPGAVMAAC